MAFYNFGLCDHASGLVAGLVAKEALMRFRLLRRLCRVLFRDFRRCLIVTAVGMWRNAFMWGCRARP